MILRRAHILYDLSRPQLLRAITAAGATGSDKREGRKTLARVDDLVCRLLFESTPIATYSSAPLRVCNLSERSRRSFLGVDCHEDISCS